MLNINESFFKQDKPIIVDRENFYLGAVINNGTQSLERKIVCQKQDSKTVDILFDSPNYEIEGLSKYSVVDLVSLDKLLDKLEYPKGLQVRDIKFIYYFILSSTRILYQNADLFGATRLERGYKGLTYYGKNICHNGEIPFEEFVKLERNLKLPINPTKEEKKSSDKTFKKQMFFIS